LRVCNTSLGGNGLKTHIIYKFEFSLTLPGRNETVTWYVLKRHRDFEELERRIGEGVRRKGRGGVGKHETLVGLYAGGVSGNILKRCRRICKYLRELVESEDRDLGCVREFLGMDQDRGEGR